MYGGQILIFHEEGFQLSFKWGGMLAYANIFLCFLNECRLRSALIESCNVWWIKPSSCAQLTGCLSANPWWRHQMETFPRYWPFVLEIPVNSPHKGQWRGALMFSLICAWINGWVNNGEAGDLRRYRTHYDVIVMPASGAEQDTWENQILPLLKFLILTILLYYLKKRQVKKC